MPQQKKEEGVNAAIADEKTLEFLKSNFDLETWQKVQSKFAELIDLPIFTMDEDGREGLTSARFPPFCQTVKAQPKGYELCKECRRANFEEMCRKGETIKFYKCHANLLNIMVPVVIGRKAIGAVVCSSITHSIKDVSACRELSKLLGIERHQLEDMISTMKPKSKADLERYGTLLYMLSQTVPELVHAKKITEERINELTIVQKLGEKINSTLDIDSITGTIMEFLKKTLKGSLFRINIFGDDETKPVSISSEEIEIDNRYEKSLFDRLKEQKNILIIHDLEGSLKKPNYDSALLVPLKSHNEIIGAISLFGNDISSIDDKKLQLLSIIADEAAMAIMNAQQYGKIMQLAVTDKLTGLYNRRYFMDVLEKEIVRAKRFFNPLSLILIDIDHFGKYNNKMGHPKGDELLKRVSGLFKAYVRSVDTVGRYGGEEFLVVLPECNEEHASIVAESLREAVEAEKFDGAEEQPYGKVTVSLGCLTSRVFHLTGEELIKETDKALYEAKNTGKNKVVQVVLKDPAIESLQPAKGITSVKE